ncbi:MAG: toll/interleukin-1 receptor domain-containing protein [Candidatus Woesearchaeota archaeon]
MPSINIGLGSLRIFLSHSSKDKILTGKLKELLEEKGLEVFIAHEDLEPCCDFEREIVKNLKRCDIFVCLLNNNFMASEWTIQELGMAVSEEKFIIPVQIDAVPFGFIRGTQALKVKVDKLNNEIDIKSLAENIFRTIMDSDKFGSEMKDFLINKLLESRSYLAANTRAKLIGGFNKFTEEQLTRLVNGTIENNQIYEGFDSRKILLAIFEKFKDDIKEEKYKEVVIKLNSS